MTREDRRFRQAGREILLATHKVGFQGRLDGGGNGPDIPPSPSETLFLGSLRARPPVGRAAKTSDIPYARCSGLPLMYHEPPDRAM